MKDKQWTREHDWAEALAWALYAAAEGWHNNRITSPASVLS